MMAAPGVSLRALAAQEQRGAGDVIVATTASMQETGLLDSVAPLFLRATGYRMRAVAGARARTAPP